MRQSKTVKRAVIIGATALLGISATLGAAQANGADTTEPKPSVTVQHAEKGSAASTDVVGKETGGGERPPLKVTREHKSGEGAEFCFTPADGQLPDGAAALSSRADQPGLLTVAKLVSKSIPQGEGKSTPQGKGGPEFCLDRFEAAKPAPRK
ncbi:hypothetical protein ACFVIM_09465 [Streptomyces sp. NPDC057638]|uniref:hypothetical protein n=1 Tax=Streptomyces sp. NPDC057638 TaxID=3346190 RepID=UPI0036869521